MAEDKRHQTVVQHIVREHLREGMKPECISISGIQNPSLESWAKRKGVRFDKKQEVDVLTGCDA